MYYDNLLSISGKLQSACDWEIELFSDQSIWSKKNVRDTECLCISPFKILMKMMSEVTAVFPVIAWGKLKEYHDYTVSNIFSIKGFNGNLKILTWKPKFSSQ